MHLLITLLITAESCKINKICNKIIFYNAYNVRFSSHRGVDNIFFQILLLVDLMKFRGI